MADLEKLLDEGAVGVEVRQIVTTRKREVVFALVDDYCCVMMMIRLAGKNDRSKPAKHNTIRIQENNKPFFGPS